MNMKSFAATIILSLSSVLAYAQEEAVAARNVVLTASGGQVSVGMELVLDALSLPRNRQVFVTPYLEGKGGQRAVLPSVLVNGRNMQYVYERTGLPRKLRAEYAQLAQVVARKNGTRQSVSYLAAVSQESWMRKGKAAFA